MGKYNHYYTIVRSATLRLCLGQKAKVFDSTEEAEQVWGGHTFHVRLEEGKVGGAIQ